MARKRKSEQDFLRARSALMRSIQRTNKAFGSSIKISNIVNVPTPAQAKSMSAAELRKATRAIQRARTDRGEKVTYVPTGEPGQVTKVRTKDYNAAMAALGKANKALRERVSITEAQGPARPGRARPVSATVVQGSRAASKMTPTQEIDPFTAFIGGRALGNVDEILRRFEERGRVYQERPRAWRESDEHMRRNFEKMFYMAGHDDMVKKLQRLSDKQLLWAVYQENLAEFISLVGMRYEKGGGGAGPDAVRRSIDREDERALQEVSNILDDAYQVMFS